MYCVFLIISLILRCRTPRYYENQTTRHIQKLRTQIYSLLMYLISCCNKTAQGTNFLVALLQQD